MTIDLRKLEEGFVAIWCLLMPVTSLLIIPSVKGTTIAYLFAFLSFGFVMVRLKKEGLTARNRKYLYLLLIVALIWLALLVGSQAGHLIDDRKDFAGAFLINGTDTKVLFRSALFTQSLYFAACILIFLYFRYYFRDEWMKYVLAGGYLMAAYGVYEWLFFLIFKHPGDFIVNRVYGEDHPGSWSQTVDFAGLSLLRIKSFFGEPSFYSAAIILYLTPAINQRRALLISLLAFNAFFSTSTSCYVGLLVCLLFHTILTPRGRVLGLFLLVTMIGAVIALAQLYPETFRGMFGDKISGENQSGHMRMESDQNTQELLRGFSPMNWMFGIGFGYSYNQISLAMLTNTGIIGFAIYCLVFLRPIFGLPRHGIYGVLKTGIFGLFFLCNLTLSEFFLATSWMFLGLAYNKLDEYRRNRLQYPNAEAILKSYREIEAHRI
jgi:hypothetical protein